MNRCSPRAFGVTLALPVSKGTSKNKLYFNGFSDECATPVVRCLNNTNAILEYLRIPLLPQGWYGIE